MTASNSIVNGTHLRVAATQSLSELRSRSAEFQELCSAARRPSPFHTLQYFDVHLAHDEFAIPSASPLLLLAFERESLIGVLPLRKRSERILGVPCMRLEFLTTHDTDRTGIIARSEDEDRCADMFYEHLLCNDPEFTFVQLLEQDEASALFRRRPTQNSKFYVREFPNNPNATIDISNGFEAWFRSLNNFRSNLRRRTRALLAAGCLEFVTCGDASIADALLELYLDIEARSWKRSAKAGIGRHPVRIEFFRALVRQDKIARPIFQFLLLDGVPIAGMLSLLFDETAYQMELTFDESYKDHSPGNVLFMLGLRDLVAWGAKAYNLLGNFAYHKSRWNATITETHAVQIYRRGSLHHYKAIAGEYLRRIRPVTTQRDVEFNLSKPSESQELAPIDREASLSRANRTFTQVLHNPTLQRLRGQQLNEILPFEHCDSRELASSRELC